MWRLKSPRMANAHSFGASRADPVEQWRHLLAQFGAGAAPAGGRGDRRSSRSSDAPQARATAAASRKRDIDAAAQLATRTKIQAGEIGIGAVGDAPTHHDADALHDMVVAQLDRVSVGRKYPGGDGGTIDFLDGDHVGIELACIATQQVDVLRLFRTGVGRQIAIIGGEPFEVPGRQLQLRAESTGRQQQEKQSGQATLDRVPT